MGFNGGAPSIWTIADHAAGWRGQSVQEKPNSHFLCEHQTLKQDELRAGKRWPRTRVLNSNKNP